MVKGYAIQFILTVFLLSFSVFSRAEEAGQQSVEFSQLFGSGKKYVHAFVSSDLGYTDNVYFTSEDMKSDLFSSLTMGLGVGYPASDPQAPSTQSAAGFLDSEGNNIFQSFLLYVTDITKYNKYEDNDSQNYLSEGIVRFSLKGGLRSDFSHQESQSIDSTLINNSIEENRYRSITQSCRILYNGNENFHVSLDFFETSIKFEEDSNSFQNRDTTTYKTGFFLPSPRSFRCHWYFQATT